MSTRFRLLIAALAMVAIAAPARAQQLSVGYQFQRVSVAGFDSLAVNLPFGIALDVAAPVSGPVEIVGEFDWSRRSDAVRGSNINVTVNYYSFGGGIRLTATAGSGIRPFAHVLAGATRISGSNSADGEDLGGDSTTRGMFDVGGGVAAPLGRALAAFGEVDYRRIFIGSGRLNSARVIVGIQLPLSVR